MGVTLVALSLAEAAPVRAQVPIPPGFAPPDPRAGAFVNAPAPPGVPGEFLGPCEQPGAAPSSPLSLSNDGSPNAFCDEDPCSCCYMGYYANIGALGLQRERPHGPALGFLDPGINIPGLPQFVDTGNPPTRFDPIILKAGDVDPNILWGPKVTVGYRYGDYRIEASGFYLPQQNSTLTLNVPRRIDLPFNNFLSATQFPLGFSGNQGLWLQADQVRTNVQSALGSAELNYRFGPRNTYGFEWIIGVRYVDFDERFGIFTDDEGLTVVDVNGNPDPTRQALYTVRTHNRILAPQIGFESECYLMPTFALGVAAKGAWGVNFLDTDVLLQRGDGFIGPAAPNTHSFTTIFSMLYEANLFADWVFNEQIRFRAAFNLLWMAHIAEASQQVDFDLTNRFGRQDHKGSVLYYGPSFELHFVF
jgi:hypothetical protein